MDDYNRHTNVWTNITGLTFERNDHTGFLVVTSSLQQVDTILYPHPTPLPIGPTVSLTLTLIVFTPDQWVPFISYVTRSNVVCSNVRAPLKILFKKNIRTK